MKVILLHEVPNLGKPGDVKEVADGYARNYLLPRQLVTAATPAALRTLQDRVAAEQRRAEKRRGEQQQLAERITAANLTFAVRVGRGDRLYGSVTSQDIANALQEVYGITLDRRMIQLRDPIRTLGMVEVPVRLAPGVEPRVKVSLIPSGSDGATQAMASSPESATQAEPSEAPVEA